MKKYAKILVSLLVIVCLAGISTAFTSCSSSKKSTTMYPTKKYKSSKPIKDNYSIRGTNKKNGSTYHSY
ncbi:MAG: hypothetical protein MJZ67_06190 [Bacteroidales bacterium]|nr:hypothetical protein [Bacteroidales bacterium]